MPYLRKPPSHAKVMTVMAVKVMTPINSDERKKLEFSSGDTVRVWSKIEDKGKVRLQAFEGLVLARKHGTEAGATFTIRKVASGVGVERIFPLYSPNIDKIEVVKRSRVRRSKLYYVREKAAREVARKMKMYTKKGKHEEEVMEEAETKQAAE
jgi:large subunit ribosomal protein L19